MKKEKVIQIIKDIQNSRDNQYSRDIQNSQHKLNYKKVNYSKATVIPNSMLKIMLKLQSITIKRLATTKVAIAMNQISVVMIKMIMGQLILKVFKDIGQRENFLNKKKVLLDIFIAKIGNAN